MPKRVLREEAATPENVKVALYDMTLRQHTQIEETEPQQKLKQPFVTNVNNSVPVLQKHVLRGNERLDGLRNSKTRFKKKTATGKPWMPKSIKELCNSSKSQQGQKEVKAALHG